MAGLQHPARVALWGLVGEVPRANVCREMGKKLRTEHRYHPFQVGSQKRAPPRISKKGQTEQEG